MLDVYGGELDLSKSLVLVADLDLLRVSLFISHHCLFVEVRRITSSFCCDLRQDAMKYSLTL